VLNSQNPPADNAVGSSIKNHPIRRTAGIVTAVGLGAAFAFAGALPANAASVTTKTGSYAEGQFLSGTIAGIDLDQIVALQSAEARNDGSSGTKEVRDPLSAAVLQTIKLNVPGGVQLDLGDVVEAGALSQYAQAKADGSSLGASGAVSNDGAIGAGTQGAGGGTTSVDLDSLLSSGFDSILADLRLDVEAVAAQANGSTEAVSGKYSLAGLKLKFTSPALANVSGKVGAAVDDVTTDLNGLTGPNGSLTNSVNGLLVSLNPVLNALGSSATANATITTDLKAPLTPLLTGTYKTEGVTLDLATGGVVVDLEKLAGGSLNSKAPNTEVLSDAVVNEILNALTDQIASIADQVKNKVEVTLKNAKVDVDVSVKALSSTPGTPGTPGTPATPGLPAVVCSVLQLLQLCQPSAGTPGTPAIPGIPAIPGLNLESTAEVHVDATVDQLLKGTAAQATADVKLLGGTVNAKLDVNAILGGLGGTLNNALFDSDSAVTDLVNDLQTGLVNPAVTALLGPGENTISEVLKGLVSVKLNIKETKIAGSQGMAVASGTLFTQTALRVSVLPDTGATGLATLNLAQATVGPQVAVIVDPGCTVNCGTTDPPTTGDPGDPGTPTNTAAVNSSLAFTGVGIATLVAILLALLAAGAYLVREGYRRRHLSE